MSDVVLTLKRLVGDRVRASVATFGILSAGAIGGGVYYTVEDPVRNLTDCTATTCKGKVPGVTAIPAGRYEVLDTYSPKYKRMMLELRMVDGHSGFTGIRIHSGNTADDTEGCLILGMSRTGIGVAQSRAAVEEFNKYARAQLRKGRLFLDITMEVPQ